jgi:hypothetical protein
MSLLFVVAKPVVVAHCWRATRPVPLYTLTPLFFLRKARTNDSASGPTIVSFFKHSIHHGPRCACLGQAPGSVKRMDRKISREVETNLADAFSQAVAVGTHDALGRHTTDPPSIGHYSERSISLNDHNSHTRQRATYTASDIEAVLDDSDVMGGRAFKLGVS